LNPQSAAWLRTNVDGNKVASRVAVSNLDGRAFVRHLLGTADGAAADGAAADGAAGAPTSPLVYGPFSRVLMNLPASAELFLDVFRGAFDRATWGAAPLPRVHCYCFSKAADPVADVLARAEAVVGCALPGAEAIVVRDVAPSKLMMCVSFVVPDEIAWRDGAEEGAADEGVKRPRLD
jgi:tRNA (guanine37-N1)-methyltransferase